MKKSINARGIALVIMGLGLFHNTSSFSLQKRTTWLPGQRNAHPLPSRRAEYFQLFAASLGSDEHDRRQQRQRFPFRQWSVDSDVMPRRESHPVDHTSNYLHLLRDWGIEQHCEPVPEFPDTIENVADAAFQAIAGTLNRKHCLDPNIANNAMARNTIVDYRPVRQDHDLGRIGIEIDGAIFLKKNCLDRTATTTTTNGPTYHDSNGSALRQLMLVLAGKFSQYPWASLESDATPFISTQQSSCSPPVAVYFNTVKQALAASQQLQILQQSAHQKSLYKNVTIHCLGQDDDLPAKMRKFSTPPADVKGGKVDGRRKKKANRKETTINQVDPSNGMVIVVQPTDFNDEYRPPGPAVGVLSSFQKLVARASAEEVPVVMVSPRFFIDSSHAGWTQGDHQAATYGGSEPPRGPTPWILRDFNPPVYVWVGAAVSLNAKDRFDNQQRQQQQGHRRHSLGSTAPEAKGAYSLITLTQSVMDEGHPWHVFGARRQSKTNDDDARKRKQPLQYEYLASTKSSPGRPTRAILRRILGEFGS